jgi:hypothetical protein
MPETIISKFNPTIWIKAIIFTAFVFGSEIACVVFSIKNKDIYSWGQYCLVTVLGVGLLYYYIKTAINTIVRITVGAGGLGIDYLLTKKHILVEYSDIIHVSSTNVGRGNDNVVVYKYLQLDIELSTGEQLTFTDNQFDNYEDLKEWIRYYRFHPGDLS